MATPATTLSFKDVLQIPAVKRLWIAQIVSVFGDFIALFAVLAYVTFNFMARQPRSAWSWSPF